MADFPAHKPVAVRTSIHHGSEPVATRCQITRVERMHPALPEGFPFLFAVDVRGHWLVVEKQLDRIQLERLALAKRKKQSHTGVGKRSQVLFKSAHTRSVATDFRAQAINVRIQ